MQTWRQFLTKRGDTLDGQEIRGQVYAIFVITVAAAEAAVGLAILLSLYRNRDTVDMERFNLLRW